MTQPTSAEIIDTYVKYRDYVKAKGAEHDAAMKPYLQAMETIEGVLSLELDRLQAESLKTEAGTAYRSVLQSPKIADRDTFLDFVVSTNNFDFFTAAVRKEAVTAYMEENAGQAPPGIEVAQIRKLNIRRS